VRRPALITAMTLLLALAACGSDDDDGAGTSTDTTVPVERSTDLVDPEGSVIGTALLRDEDADVVLELEVAGLPEGLHDVAVYESADCDDIDPQAPVIEVPRLSVLEDGAGSLSTTVSSSSLEDLVEGAAVVVTDANVDGSADAGNDLPASYLACGAFPD
jgi:Cu/Zn superoxide dismutase